MNKLVEARHMWYDLLLTILMKEGIECKEWKFGKFDA